MRALSPSPRSRDMRLRDPLARSCFGQDPLGGNHGVATENRGARPVITTFDLQRLRGLVGVLRGRAERHDEGVEELDSRLRRAWVVQPDCVPSDVVTMNSVVDIVDLDTWNESTVTIVFPDTTSLTRGRWSVLTPLGLALLGARVGQRIGWVASAPTRRASVSRIAFQQEAVGRFVL